jgi:plastocyanin
MAMNMRNVNIKMLCWALCCAAFLPGPLYAANSYVCSLTVPDTNNPAAIYSIAGSNDSPLQSVGAGNNGSSLLTAAFSLNINVGDKVTFEAPCQILLANQIWPVLYGNPSNQYILAQTTANYALAPNANTPQSTFSAPNGALYTTQEEQDSAPYYYYQFGYSPYNTYGLVSANGSHQPQSYFAPQGIIPGLNITQNVLFGSGSGDQIYSVNDYNNNKSFTYTFNNAGYYQVYVGNFGPCAAIWITVNSAQQSQTVSISPATDTIQPGQSVTFTASAKDANGNDISSANGGYTWTGLDGLSGTTGAATATGTTTTQAVTFNTVGSYTVTVSSPGNSNYPPSNTATATVTVNPSTTFTANIDATVSGDSLPTTTVTAGQLGQIAAGQTAAITVQLFYPPSQQFSYFGEVGLTMGTASMDYTTFTNLENSLSITSSNMLLGGGGWYNSLYYIWLTDEDDFGSSVPSSLASFTFKPTAAMAGNTYTFSVFGENVILSSWYWFPLAPLNTPSGGWATLSLTVAGAPPPPTPVNISATVTPQSGYTHWFTPKSLSQTINVSQ